MADRKEQVEAPTVLSFDLSLFLNRSNERLLRQKEKQRNGNGQADGGC
jgi:hypothetical protein